MTKTMKASEARQQFSRVLNQVYRKEVRVLVEKSGIPVAAIVPTEDLERLRHWEAQQEERVDLLGRLRAGFADLSEEHISQDVSNVIAQVRQEARGQRAAARNR